VWFLLCPIYAKKDSVPLRSNTPSLDRGARLVISLHSRWLKLRKFCFILMGSVLIAAAGWAGEPAVTLEFIAHAAFRVVAEDRSSLIIDPYADRVWLSYDFPAGLEADAWLISHPHYDHDGGDYRGKKPPWPVDARVLRYPGEFEVGAFRVIGIQGLHAEPYGEEFGRFNTVWRIEVGGVSLAHWGDNEPLTAPMAKALAGVEVLMLPVDGVEHLLSFAAVEEIIERLEPKILIPMHYRHPDLEPSAETPKNLGEIDRWAATRKDVVRVEDHRLELEADILAREGTAIYVMLHSPLVEAPSR